MRFVIVTGMSGAGKSTVLKMLEDMGFFCVDNLPVMLIEKFAEIAHDDKLEVDNVAIGVDIRSGQALGEMSVCLETLKKRNFTLRWSLPPCSSASRAPRPWRRSCAAERRRKQRRGTGRSWRYPAG